VKTVVRLLGMILAVAALGVATLPAGAQRVEEVLAQRRLEYSAALAAHEAAQSAYAVVEQRFSAALNEIDRARRSGDTDAHQRALAVAQERSVPKADQQRRVEQAADSLRSARQALIDILITRQQDLVGELDAATSATRRQQLDILLRDVTNELRALEDAAEDRLSLGPVATEITFDPRDGPAQLRAKAEILERLAVVVDTAIQTVDAEIEQLRERLRTERQMRDFLAGTERFGDRSVPVVTGPPGGENTVPADSAVAGGRPRTLAERITERGSFRDELIAHRDQLRIRAEQFRRAVRLMS